MTRIHLAGALRGLESLVNINSGTTNVDGVRRVRDFFASAHRPPRYRVPAGASVTVVLMGDEEAPGLPTDVSRAALVGAARVRTRY